MVTPSQMKVWLEILQRAPMVARADDAQPARPTRLAGFMRRFEAEVRREPSALSELEKLVTRLGYRLIRLDQAQAA
jgi:hypothetical protein